MSIQIDKVVMLLKTKHMPSHCCYFSFFCVWVQRQIWLQILLVRQVFIEPIWNYGVKKRWRKRAASWYGMEEAKNVKQAAKCSPLWSIACSKPHHFTFATVRRREGEEGEKEVTSTWTTACLCLLKAHKSPPSRASFWCCRPPFCRTAPAFDFLPPGQQEESAAPRASTGPEARRESISWWHKGPNKPALHFSCWYSILVLKWIWTMWLWSSALKVFRGTHSLGDSRCCCANMNGIIRRFLRMAHSPVSHWNTYTQCFSIL